MSDTTPEIAARYGDILMARPGTDRLRMACEMFDCAREMMIAGIKAEEPDISDAELRVALFLRTYGTEFTVAERERIVSGIRARAAQIAI